MTFTHELGGGNSPIYCRRYGNGVNVDVRKIDDFVDVVMDLESLPLKFNDGECERIYSRYFLEHVGWQKTPDFIRELFRILKPSGRIYIITSNLLKEAEILCRELPNPDMKDLKLFAQNTTGMIFGHQSFAENFHKGSYGPEMLKIFFEQAGFAWCHIYPLPQWFGDQTIEAFKA